MNNHKLAIEILVKNMRAVAERHGVQSLAEDADTLEGMEEWDFWMDAAHDAVVEALSMQSTPKPTRYINDLGKVGYIVSPGYGCGWFSQNGNEYPECATDPELITMVLELNDWLKDHSDELTYEDRNWDYAKHPEVTRRYNAIMDYAKTKWPNGYWTAHKLYVQWGNPGNTVAFSEFDGDESAFDTRLEGLIL